MMQAQEETIFRTQPRRTYTPPPKAARITRHYEDDLRARLAEATGTECPFQGYAHEVQYAQQEQEVGHPKLRVVNIVDDGCAVLRDPICYKIRGSKRVQQLEPEETCPIYQRTIEYLAKP